MEGTSWSVVMPSERTRFTISRLSRWAFGGGAPVLGNLVVALEAEVWCAAGGVWTLYLYNPAGAPVAPPAITFFGIKERFCQRRAA